MFWMWIIEMISLAIILLVSVWLHEYAHAYVSYRLWDPTPKIQWRLTMNPLKHMDPIWFFMVFLIWFWRWKPVQINPMYYKNPIKWEFMVAMAWPAMNLMLSIGSIILLLIFAKISWMWINDIFLGQYNFVMSFLIQFSMLNIMLAVFNLLPIPPLDWFRIVKMISYNFAMFVEKYTLYISIFFLIMLLWPGKVWIWNFLWTVSSTVFHFLLTIFSNIFY